MKLKYRPEDFIVRERNIGVDPDGHGEFGVYRLIKRKLTTLEAAGILAREFHIERKDIAFAGLKDRQSVSAQLVSIPGPMREFDERDLSLQFLGRAAEPVTSEQNEANEFTIVVRECTPKDVAVLAQNVAEVRRFGMPNYFDDQRFSCVRFGQGFVAKHMIRGDFETALRVLIAQDLVSDDRETANLKKFIDREWGQWTLLAEKLNDRQQFSSVVRFLAENPGNFVGALIRLGTGLKTIHLFAYQSHIWNRMVNEFLAHQLDKKYLDTLYGAEGPLSVWNELSEFERKRFIDDEFDVPLIDSETRIDDGQLLKALREALKRERLTLSQFKIPAEGIFFREAPRQIAVVPENLQVSDPEPDDRHTHYLKVKFSFALPRGSYGTLLIRRLFLGAPHLSDLEAPRGDFDDARSRGRGRSSHDRDRERSSHDRERYSRNRGGERSHYGRERSGGDRPNRGFRGRDDQRDGDGGNRGFRGRDDRRDNRDQRDDNHGNREHSGSGERPNRGFRGQGDGGNRGFRSRDDRPAGDQGNRGFRGRDDRRDNRDQRDDNRGNREHGGDRSDRAGYNREHGGSERPNSGFRGQGERPNRGFRGRDDRRDDDRGNRDQRDDNRGNREHSGGSERPNRGFRGQGERPNRGFRGRDDRRDDDRGNREHGGGDRGGNREHGGFGARKGRPDSDRPAPRHRSDGGEGRFNRDNDSPRKRDDNRDSAGSHRGGGGRRDNRSGDRRDERQRDHDRSTSRPPRHGGSRPPRRDGDGDGNRSSGGGGGFRPRHSGGGKPGGGPRRGGPRSGRPHRGGSGGGGRSRGDSTDNK